MTDQQDTGPLSISDAVRALSQDDRVSNPPPEEDNRDKEDAGQPQEADDEQLLVDQLAQEGDNSEETSDEQGPPEEPEQQQERGMGRFAADDHKVKLADGTVATIADLKTRSMLRDDYTRKTMALSERNKQIDQTMASFAQRENALKQHGELLAACWQELLPAEPDGSMLDPQSGQFDFIGYTRGKADWEKKSRLIQQMAANHQALIQRQAQEAEQSRVQERQRQAELLYEKKPELKDPQKYQQWWGRAVNFVGKIGYSPEDLDLVDDHRTYLVIDKAMAYDELQARVAQARTKANGRPAMLSGSARRSPDAVRSHEAKTAMARLNKSGSMQDGIAAMIALEKARR